MVDQFFDYKYGKLDYRCIIFDLKTLKKKEHQPNSVVNYPGDEKFSRVSEYKKFYNTKSDKTIIGTETFTWKGEKCYPVFDEKNTKLKEKYLKEVDKLKDVIFVGRLAQYRYLDIDKVVEEALNIFEEKLS